MVQPRRALIVALCSSGARSAMAGNAVVAGRRQAAVAARHYRRMRACMPVSVLLHVVTGTGTASYGGLLLAIVDERMRVVVGIAIRLCFIKLRWPEINW